MKEFNFEQLEVYKKAVIFVNKIFKITREWAREFLFDITSQLRRASLSIPLNIAEGSNRTKKEFRRFLDIARDSCLECVAVIEVAKNELLLDDTQHQILYQDLLTLSRMLSGLKRSLS